MCVNTYWNPEKIVQINLLAKEIETQTQRTNIWTFGGERREIN